MTHVLIVDDDEANLYYLNALLTGHGFAVESAMHGEQALAKARTNAPRLIVSDLLMPTMDGYTLLSHWKADENLKKIPFIVYTATYTDSSDERLALDLGADAFLVKGAEPQYFLARIRNVLEATASGATSPAIQQGPTDAGLLNQYSAVLVRKLEQRNLQLEETTRALAQEVAERTRLMSTQVSILNALPAHIALLDSEGVIQFVNDSWREFTDNSSLTTFNHRVGTNYLSACLDPKDNSIKVPADVIQGIKNVLRHEIKEFTLEYPFDSPAEERWFKMIASPIDGSSGNGAVVMHIDITERKVMELELRKTKDQTLLLLNSTAEGIYSVDRSGVCTLCNPAASRILGYSEPTGLVGCKVHDLHHHTYPDGTHISIGECSTYRAFHSGEKMHRDDESFFRLDGTSFPTEYWSFPTFDDSGLSGAVVTFLDITERRTLESQLLQAQKMEAIGQLTGGIAHDFNNLLTVILGCSGLMSTELAPDTRLRRFVDMIQKAGQRGAALTHQMLAFGRRQSLQPKSTDANRLLAEMQNLLRHALREDINVRLMPAPDLWSAIVDPAQLEGAILNMCINARDAMPQGGELTIETSNVWLDANYDDRSSEIVPGPYVLIAVSDNGVGIPPAMLSRIFEPFFTTKQVGQGTGLGLSMVYGFAKQSRGDVTVSSELGFGTRFKLYLPKATLQEVATEDKREVSEGGGSQRILLVEDDPLVLRFAQEHLINLGYRVTAVGNGVDALEQLYLEDNDFDLLFTDMVMSGGINGRQLADQALLLRPAIKILLASGYTDQSIIQTAGFDLGPHFLSKPYSYVGLANKLSEIFLQV